MTDLSDIEDGDPHFLRDLQNSQPAVQKAAQWLSSLGYPVTIHPTFERPSIEEMAEYSDQGDLSVHHRVEVKQRLDITFTCVEDFPFDSVIVDVCHAWDKARPRPSFYIIWNRELTAALIISRKTSRYWKRVRKLDRKKNREREFYECPMEHVKCVTV